MSKSSPATQAPHEEPEVTQEEAVPSDGRDTEGERLMKDVSNSKLHEKDEAGTRTPGKDSRSDKSS